MPCNPATLQPVSLGGPRGQSSAPLATPKNRLWPDLNNYAVGMVSWCQSSPEVQYDWRKWTDYENGRKYMAWKCGPDVRHPSLTCRFCSLFIVVAGYEDMLLWTYVRESKMAHKTGNSKTLIFVKFHWLYLYFRGRPIQRTYARHIW